MKCKLKEKIRFFFQSSQLVVWDYCYLLAWVMLSGVRLLDVFLPLFKSKNCIWTVNVAPGEYRSLFVSTLFISLLFLVDLLYSWSNVKKHNTLNRASKLWDRIFLSTVSLILFSWGIIYYILIHPLPIVILLILSITMGILLFCLKYRSILNNTNVKAKIVNYPKELLPNNMT
jgi:hypothetical protein